MYFEPAFPLLQKTLEDLIGANSICYFCFKKRRRADMQFMKAAKKAFVIEEVLDDPDREVYARENISLYASRSAEFSRTAAYPALANETQLYHQAKDEPVTRLT